MHTEPQVFDVGDAVYDLSPEPAVQAEAGEKRRPGRPKKVVEAEPEQAAETVIEIDEHDVLITRDAMTKIPKKCYAHELPALYRIHGPDMVEVIATVKVKVADFDPQMEYTRLKSKYDRKNFQCVEQVYGLDGSKVAQIVGVPFRLGIAPHRQQLSVQKIRTNPDRVRRA